MKPVWSEWLTWFFLCKSHKVKLVLVISFAERLTVKVQMNPQEVFFFPPSTSLKQNNPVYPLIKGHPVLQFTHKVHSYQGGFFYVVFFSVKNCS